MAKSPLAGIRILALENFIAGPYGSMILGDLGAEVIKIEPPSGDFARSFAGPMQNGEVFYYLAFNKNKKSLVLDLSLPSNKRAFLDLVRISDVVWDNFRPGRYGKARYRSCQVEANQSAHNKLFHLGYGRTGPLKDQLSYDIVVQAMSGIMGVTGESGRPPVRCGPPIGDLAGGIMGAVGVLSALVRRNETGKGEKVDVSLLDSCVSLMAYYFSYYFCSDIVPGPQGSGHLGVSPYGAFKTKDGRWVVTGINWPRIARVIGADWLIDDERFTTQKGRVENKKILEQYMQEYFLKADAQEWLELLRAEDMPGGLVQNVAEAVTDPQVVNNRMVLDIERKGGETLRYVGNPIKMRGVSEADYTAPPSIGEHTREVLRSILRYGPRKIERIISEANASAEELAKHLHKTS